VALTQFVTLVNYTSTHYTTWSCSPYLLSREVSGCETHFINACDRVSPLTTTQVYPSPRSTAATLAPRLRNGCEFSDIPGLSLTVSLTTFRSREKQRVSLRTSQVTRERCQVLWISLKTFQVQDFFVHFDFYMHLHHRLHGAV
jgi:hypothetical protein